MFKCCFALPRSFAVWLVSTHLCSSAAAPAQEVEERAEMDDHLMHVHSPKLPCTCTIQAVVARHHARASIRSHAHSQHWHVCLRAGCLPLAVLPPWHPVREVVLALSSSAELFFKLLGQLLSRFCAPLAGLQVWTAALIQVLRPSHGPSKFSYLYVLLYRANYLSKAHPHFEFKAQN